MNRFVNFKTLIERLKELLNTSTDTSIAEYLHLSYPSFAQMKRRDSLPYENLLILCNENNLAPLKILELNEKQYQSYYKNKMNKNTYTENIKLYDCEEYITIPNIFAKESYRIFIGNNSNINVFDTDDREFKHNQLYIIEKNNIYYKKHISINLDGHYLLTEDNVEDILLSKKEIKKVNCLGKVIYSYNLVQYNKNLNHNEDNTTLDNFKKMINLLLQDKSN